MLLLAHLFTKQVPTRQDWHPHHQYEEILLLEKRTKQSRSVCDSDDLRPFVSDFELLLRFLCIIAQSRIYCYWSRMHISWQIYEIKTSIDVWNRRLKAQQDLLDAKAGLGSHAHIDYNGCTLIRVRRL